MSILYLKIYKCWQLLEYLLIKYNFFLSTNKLNLLYIIQNKSSLTLLEMLYLLNYNIYLISIMIYLIYYIQ